jgi:spermidine synthase
VLLVLFLVSGGSGLIYEIVWTRLFTVVIGNTVFSVSAILTVFMAGLALGARVAGRRLDRKAMRLVRSYALLEGGIGLYNLFLPLLLKAADPLFGWLYSEAYRSNLVLGLGRLGISFALLIVPASLMGATLPILIRFCVENIEAIGIHTSRVYAANTLGAAIGAAAAGFVLVPNLGVTVTLYFAAGLNLAIAAIALGIAKNSPPKLGGGPSEARRGGSLAETLPLGGEFASILLAMFLSGVAALINEVAWTRVLSLLVGPTTYAFTLMLCSMITGLGLGAAIASRLTKHHEVRPNILAWIEIGIAFASFALVPLFGRLPLWIATLVKRYSGSFSALQTSEFLIFFGLMLIPTALLGMTFPIAAKLYTKSDDLLGTGVSAVYAFNTAGGILGSLIGGYILLPQIGSQNSLLLAVLLSASAGIIAARTTRWRPVLCGAIMLAAIFAIPRWNPELMAAGAYKYAPYFAPNADLEATLTSGDLLYFKEGTAATVSVKKFRGDTSLSVDGKVDASDGGDMLTQKLLAHIPLLLSDSPKNVAIIGLGSGVTAGAALAYPIEHLDVVEISPEVVQASRLFQRVNHNPLADKRTELIVGDGRNHLRYTRQQYDVIISEPSNPWMSGMASLFTREFFREARSKLTETGIDCQWFHGYNMSPEGSPNHCPDISR